MRKALVKPIIISSVPSVATAPVTVRAMSVKRLGKLRVNWFVIGSVFGIGLSFFLNFVIGVVIVPGYHSVVAKLNDVHITEVADNAVPATPATNDETAKYAQAVELASMTPANDNPIIEPSSETPQDALAAAAASTPPATYPVTLALQVTKNSTLLDMLLANHVETNDAHAVVRILASKFNPQKLPVGQKISVTLARHEKIGDAAAVKELAIRLPNLSTIELQRIKSGGFELSATEDTTSAKSFRGYGVVRSSLLQAGADGHIPPAAMQELLKAFAYDVDFQREIHPNDTIEVLMDRKPNASGQGYSGYAGIRYAALTLQGKKHEIFRTRDAYGEYAWFDGKGNSIKKSLLRTPVDAVHITSGFGMRTHPIMGYTKFHKGVDFGAPQGTPIMAAGDGVVEFKGWENGYGNFVLLKHNGKYETAYGHISRFGNISVGSRVKQGQVIAYVGMTGMATGPHLHYEVRENETQVNPISKQFNMASGLTGKALTAFLSNKKAAMAELASMGKGSPQVASAR